MPEIPIEITRFTATKLKATPDRAVARLDEQPTVRWRPTGGLTIEYIGFSTPIGQGCDIGIPHEDPENPGDWIASNANTTKDLFSYTVYAKTKDGTVVSSDPQIENEGTSGVGM